MSQLLSLRHYHHEQIAHSHDHAQLVFGLSGRLDFEVAGHGCQVSSMSFAVVPPATHHACASPLGSRCLVLDVPFDGWLQQRLGHQVDVFAAQRREHAVVRVDAVTRRGAQGGDLHALLAPFMRADHAQQLTQRDHTGRAIGRAPGLGAGLAPVGRAAQGDGVVASYRYQQRAQRARALRLRLAVQVKALGRGGPGQLLRGLGGCLGVLAVGAAHQGLQQLARILEVAAPQQGRALAGQAVGAVGAQRVVGRLHAGGRGGATLGAPAGALRLALFAPFDHRRPCNSGFS